MADNQTPLLNTGNAILTDLYASFHRYGRVATGKTINAIEMQVEEFKSLKIYGPAYLVQLEKGRGKTNPTGPYQRYGGLSFDVSLKLWMQAKGIEDKAFWAIKTSIHKKGFPGTPGLITQPLSKENIDKAVDANLGDLASIFAKNVFDQLFK